MNNSTSLKVVSQLAQKAVAQRFAGITIVNILNILGCEIFPFFAAQSRKLNYMLKRIMFLMAVLLTAGGVYAQVTTSSMSGVTRNASGEELAGASISAVHLPSGTRYSAISSTGGRFFIPNMRPGGPYRVEVSFVGFKTQTFNEVYLKLAEDFLLDATLGTSEETLTNVVITAAGRRNPILNSGRTGAMTNINRRDVERLPSISRSINDLTRLTPQSNGASVAGGNYRQNNFTIDGADFNNSFGIGTNLPAGGAPISLDAIDEIAVSISPFDIRQSGFIGSAINAVTRSGTNQFQGSVYRYWRSEKQQGGKVNKEEISRPAFDFEQIGFRIGGPIIKNKLFFFMNYETENQPDPIQTLVAATPSNPFGQNNPNVARPTAAEMDAISQYLLNTYGYATGPYDNYSTEQKRTKIMARLDWNINTKHRMNIRYSQVEGSSPNAPSGSTSGSGFFFPSNGGRNNSANTHLFFRNSSYRQGANFYSLAFELNSQLGRKFSNVLRATYTYQNDSRESDSDIFPLVDILKDGTAFTTFGYEPFSYGNLRQVKMYNITDNLTYTAGNHTLTAGFQAEFSKTLNGFQRFGTGYYVYESWDDFVSAADPNPANRVNPLNYAITYSLSEGYEQAFPTFRFAQYSLYLQDEWAVNKKFRLTYGLRADLPTYPDVSEVREHPLVSQLTFAGGRKINTGQLPKKNILLSPRVGFNYDVYGDRSLQLRGGTGIFTGRVPFVWIVSQVGDAGMLQVTQSWSGQGTVPGPFNPDPRAYLPATPPQAGTVIPGTISALDPNFKFPATWKSSLGLDTKLGWGTIFTLEAIYNRDIRTTIFENANLVNPARLGVSGYPDNRNMYPTSNNTRFINPLNNQGQASATGTQALNTIVLRNGNRGHYFSISGALTKQFDKGFTASIAYTKSFANNLYDGGGDQPFSAFTGTRQYDGTNFPELSYADYIVPDRLNAMVSYRKEYFKHLATTISVFYNGESQGRFSYTYGADFNRDGINGNDLIYVPKDASEITFVPKTVNGVTYSAQEQSDLFFAYIEQDKYLRSRKGQYAQRNGGLFPWRNQVDVRILQDVFTNIGKNKNTLQFSIDIFNFGNLLNSSWSTVKTLNNGAILVPTNQNNLVPGGTVRPTFQLATDRSGLATSTFRDNASITSTYYMQFGLRYLFN